MINNIRVLTLALFSVCSAGLAFGSQDSKTIEVHAHRFAFTPSEITVKEGETVKLKLIADDVPHSLMIKDLGVNQAAAKGKPVEITFTPKTQGDYHGQCGRFCGSGHGKMQFTVHVTGN